MELSDGPVVVCDAGPIKSEVVHLLGLLPERSTLHIARRLLRDITQQVAESGHND